ncbi:MAG: amino acid permease [Victivallales bacterium]|nr:amino acid permease [Victivallales bacterium]
MTKKSTYLSVSTLMLMTVASVISLRGLPMMAKEGLNMFFYILFATVLFLIPASLVAAELGSAFSNQRGGIYTWVKAAFGPRWGFTAIWLQWIQNVIWYPTVLGFAAGSLAYFFLAPELSTNGYYNGAVIVVFYWMATFFTLCGTATIGRITKYGVLLGTIIPGILVISLGVIWMLRGLPLEFLQPGAGALTEHVHPTFFPHISGLGSLAFLAGIVLLFAGVEVQAVHVTAMKNPSSEFPKAMFFAALIIVVLFLLGSLSVAAVIPASEISLTAGLMEAFRMLMEKFNLGFMVPILGLLTAFGAIGGVMSWISGPSRGLLSTAQEGELPPFLAKTNANGVQINILLVQGAIVTVLASLYFLMDNVSVAFFVLSAMTVTLYLVMYILMYAAALRLRYSRPDLPRSYKVPGGMIGMWIISMIGLTGVVFACVVGFFPPSNLPVGNPAFYVLLVLGGLIFFLSIPLIIHHFRKASWKVEAENDISNEKK